MTNSTESAKTDKTEDMNDLMNEAEKALETSSVEPETKPQDISSIPELSQEEADEAAELMESFLENFERPQEFQVGEKVTGTVVSIDTQYVFLDIGAKSEASISKEVLLESEGELPAIGDKLEAYVLSTQSGIELGKQFSGHDNALELLEEAYHSRVPVEGSVKSHNKGGFEVMVSGKRAFCPISQIEYRYCENPEQHVGQTYSFRIIEFKENGRNVVVSRKALLQEEMEEKAAKLKEQIVPDSEWAGTVRTLKDYGAFIEIGAGVEGLLHISEISHHRVQDPADVLSVGQQVRVKILKINEDNGRISLSMKALEMNPWDSAVTEFNEGDVVKGKIVRLQPFGAFAEIAPGVDGLIHISQLSHKRVNHPKEVVNVGDEVDCKIVNIDLDKRRIGLSLKELDSEGLPAAVEGELQQGQIVEGIVDKIETFGIFMRLPNDKRGLLPNKEIDAPSKADLSRKFPVESRVKVMIQRIERDGRIRLSIKAMESHKEKQEYKEYVKSNKKKNEDTPVFGTLGDLLSKVNDLPLKGEA